MKNTTTRAVRGITRSVLPREQRELDAKPAHALDRSREAQPSAAALERRTRLEAQRAAQARVRRGPA